MIRSAFVLACLFLFYHEAESQKQLIQKKDLEKEWLVHTGTEYVPLDQVDKPVRTIYFRLDPGVFKGDILKIESEDRFSVFINSQLYSQNENSLTISMDSLFKNVSREELFIAVHQKGNISRQLTTQIYTEVTDAGSGGDTLMLRKPTYFRDFVVVTTLFLFVFFVLMIQLNPRLSSNYFSIPKLFSLREGDDDQYYFKITSANILFYVFISMVLSLFMLIIGELSTSNDVLKIQSATFIDTVLVWIKMTIIILSLLFIKVLVVYIASFLFGISEGAGYHFFNFIRLLLITVAFLTIVLVFYYILHGSNQGVYSFLFKFFSWVLGAWAILLFFKLSNRVRFSSIHLFSYICATEILPFLIIIKILYE